MIYKIDKEMFQVELYHEGDKEPYDIIDIDEAINALRGIVYCKDCKHFSSICYEDKHYTACKLTKDRHSPQFLYSPTLFDYCSRGERNE